MALDDALFGGGDDLAPDSMADPRAIAADLTRRQVAQMPPESPVDPRMVMDRMLRKALGSQGQQPMPPPTVPGVQPGITPPPAQAAPKEPIDFSEFAGPGSSHAPIDFSEFGTAPPSAEPAKAQQPAAEPSTLQRVLETAALSNPITAPLGVAASLNRALKDTELAKGFKGGIYGGNLKNFGDAARGLGYLTDSPSIVEAGNSMAETGKSAQEGYEARVPSYRNIRTDSVGSFLEDVGSYAGYATGQGLASSAPSLVTGGAVAAITRHPVAGMVAGAALPSYIQNYGDMFGSAMEDKGISERIKKGEIDEKYVATFSALVAIPMAALDVLPDALFAKAAVATAKKAIVSRVLIGIGKGGLLEGSTEGSQEAIKQTGQHGLGSLTTMREKIDAIIDNTLGGMFPGMVMGGTTAGVQRGAPTPTPPPAAPPGAPPGIGGPPPGAGPGVGPGPGAAPGTGTPPPPPPGVSPGIMAAMAQAMRYYGYADADIANMSFQQMRDILVQKNREAAGAQPSGGEEQAEPAAPEGPRPGTRGAPVDATSADDIKAAEEVVNPNPTPGQADAENYQHAHIRMPGLGLTGANSISVETAMGGTRLGPVDKKTGAPAWTARMAATYGRIKGTEGADGQPLDIFIGPSPQNTQAVYVIDQIDPATRKFDETKIFAGFDGPANAIQAYLASHDATGPHRIGGLRTLNADEFKNWIKSGKTRSPLSDEMRQKQGKARPVKVSGVSPLAEREGPLSEQEQSALSQLRGQGNQNAPGVGSELSGVPGGGGPQSVPGGDLGAQGQQPGVRAGESVLGHPQGAGAKHAQEQTAHAPGTNANADRVGGGNRTGAVDSTLPAGAGRNDRGGSAVNGPSGGATSKIDADIEAAVNQELGLGGTAAPQNETGTSPGTQHGTGPSAAGSTALGGDGAPPQAPNTQTQPGVPAWQQGITDLFGGDEETVSGPAAGQQPANESAPNQEQDDSEVRDHYAEVDAAIRGIGIEPDSVFPVTIATAVEIMQDEGRSARDAFLIAYARDAVTQGYPAEKVKEGLDEAAATAILEPAGIPGHGVLPAEEAGAAIGGPAAPATEEHQPSSGPDGVAQTGAEAGATEGPAETAGAAEPAGGATGGTEGGVRVGPAGEPGGVLPGGEAAAPAEAAETVGGDLRAAAQADGFDTSVDYYHGTTHGRFTTFKESTEDNDVLGPAVYLSRGKGGADFYGPGRGGDLLGPFWVRGHIVTPDTVVPFHFNADGTVKRSAPAIHAMGWLKGQLTMGRRDPWGADLTPAQYAREFWKRRGVDGYDSGAGLEVAIYDPANIRAGFALEAGAKEAGDGTKTDAAQGPAGKPAAEPVPGEPAHAQEPAPVAGPRPPARPLKEIFVNVKVDVTGGQDGLVVRMPAVNALHLADQRLLGLRRLLECIRA